MKTAKEFFKEEYSDHNSMAYYPPSENRIAEIMEAYAKYYHEQQVKSVDLADVVKREFMVSGYLDELPCQITIEAATREDAIIQAKSDYEDFHIIGADEV